MCCTEDHSSLRAFPAVSVVAAAAGFIHRRGSGTFVCLQRTCPFYQQILCTLPRQVLDPPGLPAKQRHGPCPPEADGLEWEADKSTVKVGTLGDSSWVRPRGGKAGQLQGRICGPKWSLKGKQFHQFRFLY